MRRLRVPAGVVVNGRAFGGRFVSAATLAALTHRTDDRGRDAIRRLAEREGTKAERAYGKLASKFNDDPRRYAHRAADAEARLYRWQAVLESTLDADVEAADVDAVLAADATGDVEELDEALAQLAEDAAGEFDAEPRAVEWEIGFDYRSHKRGKRNPSSDFDLSLRIRRTDRVPMALDEAKHALFQFRTALMETGRAAVPRGYQLAGINWKRPRDAGWRGAGGASDLENFSDPLNAFADAASAWRLRLGAVDGEPTD